MRRPRIFAPYAEKALALVPDLAEAHTALAGAYWNDWKWDESEREFQKSAEAQLQSGGCAPLVWTLTLPGWESIPRRRSLK
jgi:hypothetical protein